MPESERIQQLPLEESPSEYTARIADEIKACAGNDKRIVFVSGNFNILHPGHLRLLNFARECGDFLVVGVNNDSALGTIVPEHLRYESIKAINVVDYSFIMKTDAEDFIIKMHPNVVVKGKEHENKYNPEKAIIQSYGGKLLFSSGEVRFSSLELMQRELHEIKFSSIYKPTDYLERHEISFAKLASYIKNFSGLKVIVIGDIIVDEYINCDPLGMSREDPTLVVTPLNCNRFIGGAGIVAAHSRGLGAEVLYYGVSGNDEAANFAKSTLESYGVMAYLLVDDSRPTTLKQRYRAGSKTLLRVSHLRQHHISNELEKQIFARLASEIEDTDLLIFSDFNYGCLPQSLVNSIIECCNKHNVMMVADSQASSQSSDITRFKGMHLITPTEYEGRLSIHDMTSGLVVLANNLLLNANAKQIFITLGSEGILIHAPSSLQNRLITDQLPSFNTAPKDVSGAGDSLLTCAALSMAVGASIWESGYLGSIAAACQVGRIGNLPLSAMDIIRELRF